MSSELAESALRFLRMAAADTQHREHAVANYTKLCQQYGASTEEIAAALLGENVNPS